MCGHRVAKPRGDFLGTPLQHATGHINDGIWSYKVHRLRLHITFGGVWWEGAPRGHCTQGAEGVNLEGPQHSSSCHVGLHRSTYRAKGSQTRYKRIAREKQLEESGIDRGDQTPGGGGGSYHQPPKS